MNETEKNKEGEGGDPLQGNKDLYWRPERELAGDGNSFSEKYYKQQKEEDDTDDTDGVPDKDGQIYFPIELTFFLEIGPSI